MATEFSSVLQAARVGADWAWTVIYREFSPAVLRYFRAHGAYESEDLLGEVFVQVVRNLPGFEGAEREFRSWVFMIARNRMVDEWRRRGRSLVDVAPDEMLLSHCAAGNAEDDAMRVLANQRVLAILQRLTTDQRDVLYLRLFAGLTAEETALVVGKRVGAVRALQARGLATIRREMSKEAVSL